MSRYTDPRWQKKRLEILSRDKFTCVACGDDKNELHVHHKVYRGVLWEAGDDDLQTLCKACHEALGPHPKGGVWWINGAFEGEATSMDFSHCPLCGCEDTRCYEGDETPRCQDCGHAIKPISIPDFSRVNYNNIYDLVHGMFESILHYWHCNEKSEKEINWRIRVLKEMLGMRPKHG